MRYFAPNQLIGRLPALAAAIALPLTLAACDMMQGDEVTTQGGITAAQITQVYGNPNGSHQTAFVPQNGATADPNNPFFQSLGTNGRSCGSCHAPAQAWGISPSEVSQRFNNTQGLDPIFRLNDGSNSPNAPVGTLAQRQSAYSLLVNRGVIRVGIGIPTGAEFSLSFVEDPYGFASAKELSLFRRPLPSTNLKFLATVMWDGRESVPGNTLDQNLSNQSNDATLGHAQAAAPVPQPTRDAIVNFEKSLFTAQITDTSATVNFVRVGAGSLTANGATGGPVNLSNVQFHVGINDVLGGDPQAPGVFTTHVFNVYDAWASTSRTAVQQSIARGQNVFNTRAIRISGVRGVNDVVQGDINATLNGTCTTCHDAPNAGDHSVGLPLDLGLTDANKFNTNDTPRYTLRNNSTGATIRTSDPGRSLIDGKWAHVATFKGPILRGLASRAPYFHNGFGTSLGAVVNFYDTRFHMGLTGQEVEDLTNFLQTL